MIRSATIYSAIVLAAAGAGLLAVCPPDLVLENIRGAGHWIAKIAIVLFAFALISCRWWTVLKQRRNPRACDQPRTLSASPYPNPGWKCITGFWFKTDLCLARMQERDPRFGPEEQYLVARQYDVCVELDGDRILTISVPWGTVTDLASVPPVFRWYVGRVGRHLEACIVHDWLYVAWQVLGLAPTDDMRLFSDRAMLAGMLASGMGCKAYVIFWAIRVFGTRIFYGRNPKPHILEKDKMPDCSDHEPPEIPAG